MWSRLSYTCTLFFVVDTNVVISHLEYMLALIEAPPIDGGLRSVVVVPWVVLQELDGLKDRDDREMSVWFHSLLAFPHSPSFPTSPR